VSFPEQEVLHLTDSDLGDPPGSRQIIAAISVDELGGLDIVYYRAGETIDPPTAWYYRVKYARIKQFAPRHPALSTYDLTADFDIIGVQGLVSDPQPNQPFNYKIGDYCSIDTRGCEVYIGYMSRHEGGPLAVYVTKMLLDCNDAADVNSDQLLNSLDPLAFADGYATGSAVADVNHDMQVDMLDISRFFEAYACGCNP
jgi:hypothetical protein